MRYMLGSEALRLSYVYLHHVNIKENWCLFLHLSLVRSSVINLSWHKDYLNGQVNKFGLALIFSW